MKLKICQWPSLILKPQPLELSQYTDDGHHECKLRHGGDKLDQRVDRYVVDNLGRWLPIGQVKDYDIRLGQSACEYAEGNINLTYHSKNAYDTTEKLWKPGLEGVATAAVLCRAMRRERVISDDIRCIRSWVIGGDVSNS